MKVKALLFCMMTVVASLSSQASPLPVEARSARQSVVDTQEEREMLARDLAAQLAEIKSSKEVARYLSKQGRQETPFSPLSAGARQRFIQSLRFSEKGLASYDYRDLRNELTATEIYRLLSLFGAEGSVFAIPDMKAESATDELIIMQGKLDRSGEMMRAPTDYEGYACISRASGAKAADHICIGSSC